MIGSLSTFQNLAIVTKDNSSGSMSDSDIIRRIFWFYIAVKWGIIWIINLIMKEDDMDVRSYLPNENKSLSIYEGYMNGVFTSSAFREE